MSDIHLADTYQLIDLGKHRPKKLPMIKPGHEFENSWPKKLDGTSPFQENVFKDSQGSKMTLDSIEYKLKNNLESNIDSNLLNLADQNI